MTTLSGLATEDYRADLAFFGRHLTGPEDFRFSRCILGTSGLSGWTAHRTGFQLEYGDESSRGQGGWEFRLSYTPPPSLEAAIPGGQVKIFFGASAKSALRERSFKEEALISITAAAPIAEDEWNGRFVYPLLNFLTLATDVPNALTRWDLSGKEEGFTVVRVVGQRIYHESGEIPEVTPHGILLPLEDLEDRFAALVARWLEIAHKYRDVCNIFFGLWYAPGAYIDMRLLGISQSLTLYQAGRANAEPPGSQNLPSYVLTSLPPEAQEAFRRWAEDVSVDTFPGTLRQLARQHQSTLEPLAPSGLDRLVEDIIRFRNYVLHRISLPGPPEGFTQGLFLTTATLSCLMKSCFLAELGFTPEERASFFERSATYGFLQAGWAARDGILKSTDVPPPGA